MHKLGNLIRHFKTSIRISWKASPTMFSFRILYELVSVTIPIITSFITKNVINLLSSEGNFTAFLQMIVALAVFQFATLALAKFSGYINTVHNESIANYIQIQISEKVSTLDISYFDDPAFYDEVQNATRDSRFLQSLTWVITSMIRGVTQLITCGIIMGKLFIWIPFMLFLLNLPSVFIDKHLKKKKYDWQRMRTENERKIHYMQTVLRSKAYAKDVRVFGTSEYFISRFKILWDEWFREKNKIDRHMLTMSYFAGAVPHLGNIFVLVYVGFSIINGTLTLGDFTYYRSMSTLFIAGINSFLMTFNNGYESEMRLTQYADFLKWEPKIDETGTRKISNIEKIEFKNVSFTYPNTNKPVLDNINFTIHDKEKIALIGVNGAGKSTLIKLLLRLYDPTDGEIIINGYNIKEYDVKMLRSLFGVVFQDYNKYSLAVRETVSITDLADKDNDERIKLACQNADIEISAENGFLNGFDTQLGRSFDKNGAVLSGGQWQKLAIAQAYFKQSGFMIMDEPNAALDPEAENRVFMNLNDLSRNKGAIIITHRMSSVIIADRIVLLDGGKVAEVGTHSELMALNGRYKQLFTTQASKYDVQLQN